MDDAAFFAYADNYLIDTDNAIIVDVEASRAIRRTRDKFGRYPEIRAADKAYCAAEKMNWLVEGEAVKKTIQ